MDEHALRGLIGDVKTGKLSRRDFMQRMMAVGLTGPLAAAMLEYSGVARAQTKPDYKPTKRGGGGPLKLLWWQGPTLLNPHFAVGTKDQDGSRIFYEPLASWDPDGVLYPLLAAEIPDLENGGLAKDGKSVIWKLKQGVQWHDGKPFTADDVVFNWQYAADPATAAVTSGTYKDIKVEKLDDHTVRVLFEKPTPFWADAFVGVRGMIIPKHLFADYTGAKSRDAPANLKPVGTGAYRFVDFKPGDMVRGEINTNYHIPNHPHFDTVEMKGGGDAVSAARAVLQTGEYDYAWGVQMEHEILRRLEQSTKGHFVIGRTANVEYIQLNQTDPGREVDGERASAKTTHPFLTDPAVRSAFALLVDRESIQKDIWGRQADTTANFMNRPPFVSANTRWEFSIDKANASLDAAGWKRGADGIRAKDGTRLKVLFQAVNQPIRQKIQTIVKQACARAGIECELKAVVGSVYFSSDPGNVDTESHFYADLELSGKILRQPDPQAFMRAFCSWEVAQKANKWSGANLSRWRNEEYDRLWRAAETEMDPARRAAQFIRMNDLVVQDVAVIAVFVRHAVFAVGNAIRGFDFSPFSGPLWRLAYWSREA